MQQEIRIATFNVLNLAPAGAQLYDNLAVATAADSEAQLRWIARQFDLMNADVVAVQEVFSQALLKDVLARTQGYRDATHIGFDPKPGAPRFTPNVAIVTRLPLAGEPRVLDFPAELEAGAEAPGFARAPLCVPIEMWPGVVVDVVAVHLKSRRPDYREGEALDDPVRYGQAHLRSLRWRALEAAALRVHVSRMIPQRPCVVLGDFNDVISAVTSEIVLGYGASPEVRLHDAASIAPNRPGNAYTLYHEEQTSTIDHILVSPALAVGEIHYFNQHLKDPEPGASDHGQVLAKLKLA